MLQFLQHMNTHHFFITKIQAVMMIQASHHGPIEWVVLTKQGHADALHATNICIFSPYPCTPETQSAPHRMRKSKLLDSFLLSTFFLVFPGTNLNFTSDKLLRFATSAVVLQHAFNLSVLGVNTLGMDLLSHSVTMTGAC